MIRKLALPIVALGMLVMAVLHVVRAQQSPPQSALLVEPPRTPFGATVAAAGIVEAQTENISIGSHLPGVVTEVPVRVGQKVQYGDVLFRLDDRQLQAELGVREANLAASEAQLARLERMPRPEEIPVSEARVREAKAVLLERDDHLRRATSLFERRALAESELVEHRQACVQAREQLARAEADLKLLMAGAWEADKAVARAAVAHSQAQLQQTRTELDRLQMRSSVNGEVLQVNVRPGEYVGTPPGQALVVLGSLGELHVRVDIDEHDIPRFKPGAPARGTLKGQPQHELPLSFVRVEPFVVPKRSLTGDTTERVDTRVLQVIYRVETSDRHTSLSAPGKRAAVYVGQQLDVFIAEPDNSWRDAEMEPDRLVQLDR